MSIPIQRQVYGLIHSVDPYKDIRPGNYPDDVRGWWSDAPVFETLIHMVAPKLIVEIGTWKGASAIRMADICDQYNMAAEIVCVDPFVGGAGTWLHNRDALRLRHGTSSMMELFLANVIRNKHSERITPFPVTASIAADIFRRKDISPDFVYLDGSHLEAEIYNDLVNFSSILSKSGVILCDDYKHSRITGPTKGVENFLRHYGGYTAIETNQVGRATEWIAPGDTLLKCVITRTDSPLLPAIRQALTPQL